MANRFLFVLALLGFSLSSSGCALLGLGAAAGAGAVGADEMSEGDEFDPLEKAYDDDPDTRPLIPDRNSEAAEEAEDAAQEAGDEVEDAADEVEDEIDDSY